MNLNFRLKRSDTKVATIEPTYRIQLNGRGDSLPGNFPDEQGFDSDNGNIRQIQRARVMCASVLVCLIGNGTRWRDWVDWEIQTSYEMGKGISGGYLKRARGRRPPILVKWKALMVHWDDMEEIIAAIECAAARRG